MDILHLKYFLEVAKSKSFSLAAQKLHVSQPTVSKLVKNIEEELGILLFDRSSRQIELTDAGKILYKQGLQIITLFENIPVELLDVKGLKKGQIKIGLPPMVGARFFPQIISEFNKLYPLIKIKLFEYGAKKVETELLQGNIDIGVVLLPIDQEDFAFFPFVNNPLMLLVHPNHPLAGKAAVALRELSNENFIFLSKDFTLHNLIYEECIKKGFHPKIIYESSQWDFISEMVAANLGIALLPEPVCRNLDSNRIKTIPLNEPTINWYLAIAWRKNKYLSYAAKEWINFTHSFLHQV